MGRAGEAHGYGVGRRAVGSEHRPTRADQLGIGRRRKPFVGHYKVERLSAPFWAPRVPNSVFLTPPIGKARPRISSRITATKHWYSGDNRIPKRAVHSVRVLSANAIVGSDRKDSSDPSPRTSCLKNTRGHIANKVASCQGGYLTKCGLAPTVNAADRPPGAARWPVGSCPGHGSSGACPPATCPPGNCRSEPPHATDQTQRSSPNAASFRECP